MENLENLEEKAREALHAMQGEAACHGFLWELGMRVPSAHQARRVCKILSLDVADERRIKAVMKLREENPQALVEIHDEAASSQEDEMPEVMWGRVHFNKQRDRAIKHARQRDVALWKKIFEQVRIESVPLYGGLLPSRRYYFLQHKLGLYESLANDYIVVSERGWSDAIIYLYAPESDSADLTLPPVNIRMAQSFFVPKQMSPNSKSEWNTAILSVNRGKRSNLLLARKLAEAYEAETRRRRKPAKAVVVKNY